MIGAMFNSAQPLLLAFAFERPIFLREYSSNMYNSAAYFLANGCVEMPLTFLTVLETWLLSYWCMDFQGNILFLVLTTFGLALSSSSLALVIGCSVASIKTAQEFVPILFVPQIMFTGIFVSVDLIPEALRWLQYVCALKYGINLAALTEFNHLSDEHRESLFSQFDIREELWWMYSLIILSLIVGFRVMACISLSLKAKWVC